MSKIKKYILAIDQGTTSTRAILYNRKITPIKTSQKEFKQFFPHDGWVEHDPIEIWKSVIISIKKVLKKSNVKPSDIAAIGITNQRETTIIWDKTTGKPIYNAIVWQDRRTSIYCNKIKNKKKLEDSIIKITGLTIDSYFSATKIKWLLDNVKNSRKLAKKNKLLFGTIDTWLLWKLTKGRSHITDVTNASRTMLYDINKGNWSKKLLKFFNIPNSILPKVVDNIYHFGTTEILRNKIKISSMIGDQQSALIGNACFNKGMSKSTYGTGCFFLMNIGNKIKLSKNKLLTSIAYQLNGKIHYCIEGSIFIAGAAVQWLRDGIKIIKHPEETEKLYIKADNEQNIYFVPAFTGMGAPYWESDARGAIYGINRNTGIPEIVMATLRSICFQTKDLVNSLEEDSKTKINEIRIDGGMINNKEFVQFLCNILNIKIIVPIYSETTALGVAYLCGIDSGFIKDINQITKMWRKQKTYYPNMKESVRKKLYMNWNKAVKKTIMSL